MSTASCYFVLLCCRSFVPQADKSHTICHPDQREGSAAEMQRKRKSTANWYCYVADPSFLRMTKATAFFILTKGKNPQPKSTEKGRALPIGIWCCYVADPSFLRMTKATPFVILTKGKNPQPKSTEKGRALPFVILCCFVADPSFLRMAKATAFIILTQGKNPQPKSTEKGKQCQLLFCSALLQILRSTQDDNIT